MSIPSVYPSFLLSYYPTITMRERVANFKLRINIEMETDLEFDGEPIVFCFVDQSAVKKDCQRSRFHPEIIRDGFQIDFDDMLEREWELEESSSKNTQGKIESKVLGKHKHKHNDEQAVKSSEQSQQDQLPMLKTSDVQESKSLMPAAQTVFKTPETITDIDSFFESLSFLNCIRFFVLLFIIGVALTDYSFRLSKPSRVQPMISMRNKLSLYFQLLANCAFTVEIFLRMFSTQKFFSDPWRILSLIGTISCWICISLDFIKHDDHSLFQLLTILKILLALRVIEAFESIRNPFEDFITTIPDLGKIFFPLLIFLSFYSVLGLILFEGATEYKCRETEHPVDKTWPEVSSQLCGSDSYQCTSGFCGNPYKFGLGQNMTELTEAGNEYGLVNFDNIGSAFLTTYHYVFLSNWTSIKYKFSKYLTPYVTTLYFFTLALFLFFIMANLNMITICKAYIEREKKREKFIQPAPESPEKEDITHFLSPSQNCLYCIVDQVDLLLSLVAAVIIICDWEGISSKVRQQTETANFILTWLCFAVLLIKMAITRSKFLSVSFILLDWLTIGLSVGDIIYSFIETGGPTVASRQVHTLLQSVKFYRIIKILFFSKNWFKYEKNVLGIFVETVKSLRYFFVLLCCIILVSSFIGQKLFAFKVRFDPITKELDILNGEPYISNFESSYKSLVSMMFILENERWTETMYKYFKAVGWEAVIFFIIVTFIVHLMLTRLFIAIFLCYFRRNLEKEHASEENIREERAFKVQAVVDEKIIESLEDKDKEKEKDNGKFKDLLPKKKPGDSKIFWVFQRTHFFFHILRSVYNSQPLKKLIMGMLFMHCITIVIRTKTDSVAKTEIIDVIESIAFLFYIFEVTIGILGHGLLIGEKTYLKESKANYLNILVVLFILLSRMPFMEELQARIISRFAIIKIFTPFSQVNKETEIILRSISSIAKSFGRIFLMYLFLLLIPSLLPMKLQREQLYKCKNYHTFSELVPTTMQECTIAGGDWVNDAQAFRDILESLLLMYQIVTSESWTYFIENFDLTQPWDVYFVLTFFFFNTCLLNIFVGLIVETYLSLKDEAYRLNLLRPSQRGWILIRNSINELIPVPAMKEPDSSSSSFQRFAFNIISQKIYQNCIDILPYISVIIYAMRYYRAEQSYLYTLKMINSIILAILCIDTVMKLQLKWDYFFLENSKVELAGFIFFILYALTKFKIEGMHDINLTFEFLVALFILLRCKKLIFRYTWSKTLINSVIDILPKCLRIGIILAVVLFFYVSIGMEVFKHVKPTPYSDGYTTGFDDAFTSLMTLLKIVSNQSWFNQVSAFVRGPTPSDYCYRIKTMEDALRQPYMGCGTPAAYLFFISFHVIMALLILNLLIATMTAAYDENYEKEYKSVNIFQLQDTLKLWQKYDPRGTGVIPYKKFWRLSSEIAILFGISKKKLIKRKQKFMEELDIEICQSIDSSETSVLCYKFHDVIMKFSKIKLTVSKGDGNDEASQTIDFEIHPMIQREIKDYIIDAPSLYKNIRLFKNYKSGEMRYFFGLLRKLRAWRIVAKKKDTSVISKLSNIIKVALEKRQREEQQINEMRNTITQFMNQI